MDRQPTPSVEPDGGEPPGKRLPARPHDNLPAALTPFVGRGSEYTQLITRLGDSGYRLVTITGVGGVGKSRLALEVAAPGFLQLHPEEHEHERRDDEDEERRSPAEQVTDQTAEE